MKKTLLITLMALPFLVNAQVATPEKVYTAQPNTGFTAVASSEMAGNPAPLTVDGDNASYWETPWTPAVTPLPHTLTITLPSAQNIDGIYIVDRNNLGNSPKVCTIETSVDNGGNWIDQGTYTLPYDASSVKLFLKFTATVTGATNYRIIITENQVATNQVTNIAETGVIALVPDNTTWDRTGWIATGDNTHGTDGGGDSGGYAALVDNDITTYWHTRWGAGTAGAEGTIGPFPGDAATNSGSVNLNFDMLTNKLINQISFVSRAGYAHRNPNTFTVAYSTDGIAYTTLGPFLNTDMVTANPNAIKIALGTNITARYLRINITKVNKIGTDPNTSIAEFRAHYNATLPIQLASFTAKSNGSSVSLKWTTATESNASHFDVTRSTDGSNFNSIGKVTVTGSGSTYNYTDFSPVKGNNYYQLVSVDNDGTSEKSAIEVAKVAANGNELIVTATSANSVTLNVYAAKATTGSIIASNVIGQKIATQAVKLAEGNNSITVATGTSKGLIIVSLNTAEGTISKKIIK